MFTMDDQVIFIIIIQLRNKIKFLLGCLPPIKSFTTANRYETAALCGLVVFDVLIALEHFLIDISQLWKQGVLTQFLDRTLTPLIYGLVFYFIFLI